MRKFLLYVLCPFAVLAYSSCSGGDIRLDVTPMVTVHAYEPPGADQPVVGVNGFYAMEFTWKVGPDFTPPKLNDLRALVHFRDTAGDPLYDASGNLLNGDHDFEIPVKDWKPGEDIVYTIPDFQFDESLTQDSMLVRVYVGIYSPGERKRAELTVDDSIEERNRSYRVAEFFLQRDPRMFPIFNETWYGPEPPPNQAHRWSKQASYVTFLRDPQAPAAELWIEGHSPVKDLEGDEQRLYLYIHEKKPEMLLGGGPIVLKSDYLQPTRILIPTELYQTYADQDIKIILEVDSVLRPGAGDSRGELGFRLYQMLLQPRNLDR